MSDEAAIIAREAGLSKSLSRGQIIMIGLGGAIGTGLFMGSGIAIGYAGPGVLISYLIAAFAAMVVVFSLSEMVVLHPAAGSFGVYAETYLNRWAGFVVRYTYWAAQVIAVGGEAVAAGTYMSWWFPGVPVWCWSLGFAAILLYVNARSVANFGSFEYVFSVIKVTAIVGFIILGGAAILGVGQPAVGFHNLYALPGGFLPHGWKGVWMGTIMALSSMNANIYLSARMLFSLSRGGYAPARLGGLSRTGAPTAAIIISGACVVAAAAISFFTPLAYNYLFGVALFGAIFVWIIILLSHLGFRRRHRGQDLPVRMPFFPVLQIAGLFLLTAILVTMGLDTEFWNISWIVGVPWLALLTAAYFVRRRRRGRIAPSAA